MRYFAAGDFLEIDPAGEMWSVVTESPRRARHFAPCTSASAGGALGMSVKNGGLRTYVDFSSHTKVLPCGTSSLRHTASPSNTLAYSRVYCSGFTAARMVSTISWFDGHRSRR
jgi:hypothetical protein